MRLFGSPTTADNSIASGLRQMWRRACEREGRKITIIVWYVSLCHAIQWLAI